MPEKLPPPDSLPEIPQAPKQDTLSESTTFKIFTVSPRPHLSYHKSYPPIPENLLEHTQPIGQNLFAVFLEEDHKNGNKILSEINPRPGQLKVVEILSKNGSHETREVIIVARPQIFSLPARIDIDNPFQTEIFFPDRTNFILEEVSNGHTPQSNLPFFIQVGNVKYMRQANKVYVTQENPDKPKRSITIDQFFKRILNYKDMTYDAQTIAAVYQLQVALEFKSKSNKGIPHPKVDISPLDNYVLNSFSGVRHKNPWFKVISTNEGDFIETTNEATAVIVEFRNGKPLFKLAIEYSPALLNEACIVLAGGGIKEKEDKIKAALREAEEELNIKPKSADTVQLGQIKGSRFLLNSKSAVVLITTNEPFEKVDITQTDADEQFEVGTMTLDLNQLKWLIYLGYIQDTRAIAAIGMAEHYLSLAA